MQNECERIIVKITILMLGKREKMDGLYYKGKGYMPLVMTENWQLAQLNYTEEQEASAITDYDRHTFTDETFTLLDGRAMLITYEEGGLPDLTFLEKNITYNVPQMMWHNIAMEKGSVVLITEGRDAHLKGCDHIPIPQDHRERIKSATQKKWG